MLTRKHYVGVSFNDCLRIPIDDLKSSIGVDIYFLKLLLITIHRKGRKSISKYLSTQLDLSRSYQM